MISAEWLRPMLSLFCILFLAGPTWVLAQEEVAAPVAESSNLIKRVNLEMLEGMVKRSGDTIEASDFFNDKTPRVQAKTEEGMVYFLFGTACSEDGYCKGIELQAVFSPGEDRTYDLEMANELNVKFGAVSIFLTDSGNISVSRYLILDFGQAPENVELNLEVFQSISGRISELLNSVEADG